jgi:S1-C subfamily serine protease
VNIDAIYVLRSNAEGIEFAISIDQADEAVPELPITGGVLVV